MLQVTAYTWFDQVCLTVTDVVEREDGTSGRDLVYRGFWPDPHCHPFAYSDALCWLANWLQEAAQSLG